MFVIARNRLHPISKTSVHDGICFNLLSELSVPLLHWKALSNELSEENTSTALNVQKANLVYKFENI